MMIMKSSPALILFPILWMVCALFSATTEAQTYHNITLGSSLTPQGPNSTYLSPSGDFAVGFLPLNTTNNATVFFLLAIWFARTPGKTVVWSANGGNPIDVGSRLTLGVDGRLSLANHSGGIVWSVGGAGVDHAAILDTGNLVLVGANGAVVWESFANPTDTMLPTQTLPLGAMLLSRFSDANYSSGRFQLIAQVDGNLVLYQVAVPTGVTYSPYWATSTVGNGSQLVFDPSGVIYLLKNDKTRITILSTSQTTATNSYQRATLDLDGAFRQYTYPKNGFGPGGGNARDWSIAAHVPSDVCHDVLMSNTGSGVCGYNSYCQVGSDLMSTCLCPPSHTFVDPSNKFAGCQPDSVVAQSCTHDQSGLFDLVEIINANWPDGDYEHYSPMTEDQCRASCLSDCYCGAVVFGGQACWKKKMPLSNGRMAASEQGSKTLIKVAKGGGTQNNTSPSPMPPSMTGSDGKKDHLNDSIIIGSIFLGCSIIINFFLIAGTRSTTFGFDGRRKIQKVRSDSEAFGINLHPFTYKELDNATNGFKEELGSGSFGTVYKGILCPSNPADIVYIAVKKLNKLSPETEKEFVAEIRSIGQTHHKNLVRLLGFCNEGAHRLLVYKYMSNGSLTQCLLGEERPGWNHRIQIALGIARGLAYLHEECSPHIIHCDVKTHNVLLDDDLVPKISDFGLAKLLMADQASRNTAIRGTKGYVAPEWFNNMPITAKVDVYSFGVTLLEIICCRRHLEPAAGNEDELVLVDWAYDCYRGRRLDLLVGKDGEAMADMERVERLVVVAIWCIQEDPSLRPSMSKVVQMLQEVIDVPAPPDPSSEIRSF